MSVTSVKNNVAIIGASETTELGRIPHLSAIALHADAARNAIADCGISKDEIDGIACAGQSPVAVAHYLGITPRYLDGTSVGDLLFGETLTREIAPGRHTLRVHNTLFWKTLEFDAAAGEQVHFSTVNYAGRGFLNLALIIGVAPLFLKVERVVP